MGGIFLASQQAIRYGGREFEDKFCRPESYFARGRCGCGGWSLAWRRFRTLEQQSGKAEEPLPLLRAYKPRSAATEAIPDLRSVW